MMHTLLYSEMNQAVPSLSPGHEGGGYGECQVPSPSQWSDPCYSPPSFHSPQHLPVELEKVKEEPFSPPCGTSYLSLSPSPPAAPHLSLSSGGAAPPHHGSSPYARPASAGHVIKKDAYESCINLADLLNDNHNLMHQHAANGIGSPPLSSSSTYGGGYPDHPLLRGRLEETNLVFHHHHHQQQKKMAAAASPPPAGGQVYDGHHHSPMSLEEQVASFHKMSPAPSPSSSSCSSSSSYKDSSSSSSSNDGLSFLESLVDVKQEIEDDVSIGSSCGSPAAPSPTGAGGQREVSPVPQVSSSCQRDILETVEILAQEHNRRDVQRVSDSLNIPRDPAQWSVEDVRAWLKLQASQLNLPPLMLDFWNYGGPSLLKLTEQQFRQLAPIGGELLYAKLEIWREALRSSPKLSSSSPSSSPNHHHSYTFIHHHQGTTVLPSQDHQHHHLMVTSAHHHLHLHQQLQQQQQQVVHSSGASSPTTLGTAPASPPLPLVPSMTQVPAPVAQVNQQQQQQQSAAAAAPPSPQQQQQGSASSSSVYLEEPCLDMATLLQQQPASSSPKPPKGANTNSPSNNSHCPQQPDDAYDSEEEVEEETCTTGGGSGRGGTHIHLWQFLKELLQQPQLYGSCIRWLDRQKGVFKIEDSVRVARLWGKRKNRPAMNYDKLSRSIRQYYKKGIMKKTERSQRLVYQFCHPYCL